MNKICVIIPMYGKPELTNKCVDFCRANAGIKHDILVVDDGSPEPYKHAGVNVLRLEANGGFTGAVNAGIRWCGERYDYLHLLNNDTEPKEDFLKLLYEALETNEGVGVAGSARIVEHEGKPVYELVAADLVSGYHTFTESIKDLPQLIHTYWFPLCSAMIRYRLIQEIGLLDKRMRTWCSDNDFCIRANFAGWNTTLVPASQVFHIHQATTGKAPSAEVKKDQDILMNKIMNVDYAVLLDKLPLDAGSKTFGRPDFKVYKR